MNKSIRANEDSLIGFFCLSSARTWYCTGFALIYCRAISNPLQINGANIKGW